MTTIAFTPSNNAAPPFTALVVLDGGTYQLAATWNLYREDWYISLYDENNALVVNQPLIGSPDDANIALAPGLFDDVLIFRTSSQSFVVNP